MHSFSVQNAFYLGMATGTKYSRAADSKPDKLGYGFEFVPAGTSVVESDRVL